jgi:hypothetical protein
VKESPVDLWKRSSTQKSRNGTVYLIYIKTLNTLPKKSNAKKYFSVMYSHGTWADIRGNPQASKAEARLESQVYIHRFPEKH